MTRNVQQILEDVMDALGLEYDHTTFAIADVDVTEKNLLFHMTQAGISIAKRANWPGLITRQALSTTAPVVGGFPGGSNATLPTDFNAFLEGGVTMGGSTLRPAESWSAWAGAAGSGEGSYYFMVGSRLLVNSAPGIVTVVYASKNWILNKEVPTAKTDVPLVPFELVRDGTIWRWYRENGMAYDFLKSQFDEDFQLYYKDAIGMTR